MKPVPRVMATGINQIDDNMQIFFRRVFQLHVRRDPLMATIGWLIPWEHPGF